MKLNDLFTRNVITAGPEEALAGIALRMQEYNVGTVVIVDAGRPVGIITDRDLAIALGARGLSPKVPVREVMTRHVLAVPEDTGVFTATRFIQDRKVRRLPVVDREDRLVGLVSLDDLLRWLARELSNLAEGIGPEVQVK
jgi:CBS domain-containing protein